jgi:hypothetical protein
VRFFCWPFLLRARGLLSALASSTVTRTEKSQEMKAMRLTRNEHHRKLRVFIGDISDWLVNTVKPGYKNVQNQAFRVEYKEIF